ncbi:hypothetical protein [Faecalicatena contorta]|uniref:hypothetical protein n=1 Tax=Faecalicatena contorta TaxID=39482 RepID=UPI001FACE8F8|nr:hypothetical protein [Faecalicatena contorta]
MAEKMKYLLLHLAGNSMRNPLYYKYFGSIEIRRIKREGYLMLTGMKKLFAPVDMTEGSP